LSVWSLTIPQRLRSLSDLVLQAEVFCALHGRQKLAQLTLFVLEQIEALTLQLKRFVEKLSNFRLIGAVSRHELCSQRLASLPVASQKVGALLLELTVSGLEPRHLVIAERKTLLHDFSRALPQLLLELETSRVGRFCCG